MWHVGKTALAVLCALLTCSIMRVLCDEHNHVYNSNEEVVAWMNTVGPLHNTQETYPYFQLPFCHGDIEIEHHHETLGEALQGMDLANKLEPVTEQRFCSKTLSSQEVMMLQFAVENNYWYTMFIDDLPVHGSVGQVSATYDDTRAVIVDDTPHTMAVFTHKYFVIEYNDDRIIAVNMQPGNLVELKPERGVLKLDFTYTVEWRPSTVRFQDRFDKLLEADFFEHNVHWLSIFSSFMLVLFLTGLVSVILLRTVKRDFSRYDRDEEGVGDFDRDLGDDYGWKQVHGDVFRQPPHLILLSAMMGTGHQLVVLASLVILYTIFGHLYAERATILSAAIFFYTLTSTVAGYTSAKFYALYGGKNWVRNVIVTASLWPATMVCIGGYVNSVAIFYSSSRAIAFSALATIIAIWLFLCLPLTILGAIVLRNWGTAKSNFPCRVNPIPRPIPEKMWYAEPMMIGAIGGILPFGSIFIEMYFIFSSFWTYKIYYVYGFMFLVYGILLVVCACVSIVSTYFLLNSEDHRWHWVSWMSCASTSMYVYLYAIYYFLTKTKMTGMFQTSFYFGYSALLSLGLFCMLGFVGHWSASKFVRAIYQNVKID